MLPKSANIVIVGGGMVGASLATAIAASPYLKNKKVCLLEAAPRPKHHLPNCTSELFSNRVSALNGATTKLLKSIGAWNDIADSGRCHGFTRMLVWD